MAQEDHLLDAEVLGSRPLLLLALRGQPAGTQVGIVAALVAAREQDVLDAPAGLSPLHDRPGAPELGVVGVGADHHHPLGRVRGVGGGCFCCDLSRGR